MSARYETTGGMADGHAPFVDFACSHPHYIDHAAPVWHLLPHEHRGTFFVTPELVEHARALGIETSTDWQDFDERRIVVVLSMRDENRLPTTRRRLVFLEHGLGQAYNGRAHTRGKRRYIAFLTNPCNAEPLARCNPHAQIRVVGPVKLDSLVEHEHTAGPPVVAFSHHWQQNVCAETRSAFPWSQEAWERVAASGRYRLIGHKHPADRRDIEGWCESIGIEFVADFSEILRRADIYVCDNSSTLYEFAAHGRPVVCLSPPFYRRDVDHNPRFWAHVPGPQVSHPDELEAVIAEALLDVPERRVLRERAVAAVYGTLDGQAASRAATGLVEIATAPVVTQRPSSEMPSVTVRTKEVIMYVSDKRVVRDGKLIAFAGEQMSRDEAKRRGLIKTSKVEIEKSIDPKAEAVMPPKPKKPRKPRKKAAKK